MEWTHVVLRRSCVSADALLDSVRGGLTLGLDAFAFLDAARDASVDVVQCLVRAADLCVCMGTEVLMRVRVSSNMVPDRTTATCIIGLRYSSLFVTQTSCPSEKALCGDTAPRSIS